MGPSSSSPCLDGLEYSFHPGTSLAPPTHISSLDIGSSSVDESIDGSDDGDTHDPMSKLWWEDTASDDNSSSSDPNSGGMSADSEEDSENNLKSIVQDVNESFFQLPNTLVDLQK